MAVKLNKMNFIVLISSYLWGQSQQSSKRPNNQNGDGYHPPPETSFKEDTYKLTGMESADNLIPVIKSRHKYNMFLAPGQAKAGKPTRVSVAMYIESMSSFKAQTMDFEVDMYLAMSWVDPRLAHNRTHPVLIAKKGLAERIWHPDLYFVNSKFAYLQEVTTPNFMILVYPDGFIFKSMRVDVTLSCNVVLNRYPMDTQICPITIQSYAYIESLLNLTWHEDSEKGFPIGSNENIKLNDMQITERHWSWCGGPYPMFRGKGHWSCIQATLEMKRLVTFHVIQTYIPTGMLVMISWLSFWLDPRAGPARISLTITTLLTLTTMSNSARQDLPQVSYIKALDVWLSVCTAFVFCVLLEYTLVSCFIKRRSSQCAHIKIVQKMAENNGQTVLFNNHRNNVTTDEEDDDDDVDGDDIEREDENPLSSIVDVAAATKPALNHKIRFHHRRKVSSTPSNGHLSSSSLQPPSYQPPPIRSCGFCAQGWERSARRVDRFSRTGFPALFTAFTLVYWLLYNNFDS